MYINGSVGTDGTRTHGQVVAEQVCLCGQAALGEDTQSSTDVCVCVCVSVWVGGCIYPPLAQKVAVLLLSNGQEILLSLFSVEGLSSEQNYI